MPLSPFVDPRFLQALKDQGCVGPGTGWDEVTGLDAPAYLKAHSHGEFVFDWMWAQGAQRAGIAWYPKLLIGAPFSPVTGPRLSLTDRSLDAMHHCIVSITEYCQHSGLSNAGINFCDSLDRQVLDETAWLARFDWQFHWHNDAYSCFEDFLAQLKRKARKNIQAERRKVYEQGWQCQWITGTEASSGDIDLAYHCYQNTHALYGNYPALNEAFFVQAAREFGDQFLLCVGQKDSQPLAAAIFLRDDQRLYGRYWGSLIETKDLHFELCYYQGIDYCIQHGLTWFEPGAQGEHKIKRGFLPQKTFSYHWFANTHLSRAIADYLQREGQALDEYRASLERLNPFSAAKPDE